MSFRRIIPCLDIKNGRVVKGVSFVNLKDAGDPVACAKAYCQAGADELVALDITASTENRKTIIDVVRQIAENISIPLAVGGGISDIEDISNLLNAGACKVSINTAAVKNPGLISRAAERFGSHRVVCAIDAKKNGNRFEVYIKGGQTPAGIDAVEWARKAESLGAGEILLTSIDRDGTKCGYDIVLTRSVADAVSIPVIASGGAGNIGHFKEVFEQAHADAALAASLFHFREVDIRELKKHLKNFNIPVRI
ncbi:MAG TPA: imidazole glycerol phosphate synthase subunit HisF [Clostridiales bacterium]|nr:imidazole glycerol phosphate synthase subunit HisF [Clostridiales bacterium]